MPTNTTTPEAATTTTPAANTNTTPLSAMTGEEVASILVGLIRQNDGVIIQQKVTDGINQSNADAKMTQVVTKLQQIIDSGRINFDMTLEGWTFADQYSPQTFSQAISAVYNGLLKRVVDASNVFATKIIQLSPLIEYVELTNVTSFGIYREGLHNCTVLTEMKMPNLSSITQSTFSGAVKLRKLFIPKLNNVGTYTEFSNCRDLIDLTIGAYLNGNQSLTSTSYNPTNAYSLNNDLCFSTDTTEYATEMARESRTTGFTTNREKWNFLLRQHFAYNLPNRTGQTAYTITFGSTLLAVMEQSTKDAFTDKGWAYA